MKNHLTPPSDKGIYQKKKTTSIGKDVVKMKATFTVGGNVIFLSFYGKHDSPEKKNKVWRALVSQARPLLVCNQI